jgi:hypothetical protein
MTRHWKLIVGIVGVLALVGLGVGLAIGLSRSMASPGSVSTGLSAVQKERLEKGIIAPTIASQASVVASDVRGQFVSRGKPLLPPRSHLSIKDATFHALSAQVATVDAAVTGPKPGHWQLVLVRESGKWLLIGTRRLS